MTNTDALTKNQLWQQQAPFLNFELDADELLAKALREGFVVAVGSGDLYVHNPAWAGAE
jgi:hypothetical protein